MAGTCAYLDGQMYYPEPTPWEKTGAVSDSALSVIMTTMNLHTPGSGWQLGGYWLRGYLDTDWESMP